jgi:hypothetical protein
VKPLILILAVLATGCAYNGGKDTWYPGQPIPYTVGPAWSAQPMPNQSVYIVNGSAYTVYKSR